MKWLVPAIVGFILIAFLGIVFVGLGIQSSTNDQDAAYPYPAYSSYSGAYTGTGPEWDKYKEAEKKGLEGLSDMQALMLSTDVSVASQAFQSLVSRFVEEGAPLFLEQLPKVDPSVKNTLRSSWYDSTIIVKAAKAVKAKDPKTVEGGMTFLNLCYMRDSQGDDKAFNIVVSAIPDYKGAEADKLAYTIGQFRPKNPQALIDLLSHPDARVRQTAVVALGKMESEPALAKIKLAKRDSSASVRSAALTAESSINAGIAAAKAAASYSYSADPAAEVAMASARTKTKERLGMP